MTNTTDRMADQRIEAADHIIEIAADSGGWTLAVEAGQLLADHSYFGCGLVARRCAQ